MSNRYAVVENGFVTNVVLWDGAIEWQAPSGSTVNLLPSDSPVGPGYAFDGTEYTAPPSTGISGD